MNASANVASPAVGVCRTQSRNGSAERCGWHLPAKVRSYSRQLFTQQIWCWGLDVKADIKNLLVEYGFKPERRTDLQGQKIGSTCYRIDRADCLIVLWSFGMYFSTPSLGGLYFDRFKFTPQWSNVIEIAPGVHTREQLPNVHRPRTKRQWRAAHVLFRESLNWIAEYEHWVRSTPGLPYRKLCVSQWLYPFVRASAMPAAWKSLGNRRWETSEKGWAELQERCLIADPRHISGKVDRRREASARHA